jgi:hypothetical protein
MIGSFMSPMTGQLPVAIPVIDDGRSAYTLETRRRVKEQIKKIGGVEFFDVHFSYLDHETREEKFISVPELRMTWIADPNPLCNKLCIS